MRLKIRKREKESTSKGDVRNTMLARDVEGVGEEAVQRLGDHGKVGGAEKELKSGGVHAHAVL